jgi:hypothetical protein
MFLPSINRATQLVKQSRFTLQNGKYFRKGQRNGRNCRKLHLKKRTPRSMFVVAIYPCAIASTFDKLRILFSQLPLTVAEKE